MATLLEQLQSITSGASVSGDIAAQVGQFTQIAQLVQQFTQQPPGDFASYLSQLQELPLPQVSVAGGLGQSLGAVLPDLQGGLGGLLPSLLEAVGQIEGRVGGGLLQAVQPLVDAIAQLQVLFASDWSCALVPALAPPAANPLPAPNQPPAPPPPAPAPVLSPAQVSAAQTMVATLPADMSVPALLKWLHGHVGTPRPGYFYFRSIPVLDDVRDPLDTLVRWDGLNGVQLAQELALTLNAVAAVIHANTTALVSNTFPNAVVQALPAQDFAQAGNALGDALDALLAAVQTQNMGEVATQLTAAQAAATQIETLNTTLDGQAPALQQFQARLRALPGELETAICRLLVLLQPRATWGDISSRLGDSPTPLSADTFAPLTQLIARVQEFLENLLKLIDVSAVTQPLVQIFTQAGQSIDQVEQGLAQLTATARAQFQQAHTALTALDLTAVQQQAEQSLEQAAQQVQQTLGQGLAVAATALSQALSTIDSALAGFDPEQLGQPVQQVMDALQQVFQDPAVQQAVQQLQQLQQLAARLDEMSFRPVGDVVIGGIGEVKSALESIDSTNLSPPMPEMIRTAMSVLPASLTPLTDPLVTQLDELLDQGPIALLEAIKDLPRPVVEQLENFSPRALLEEPLGTPFKALQAQLDDFQPSHWLDAANNELDSLKGRIADSLDLGPLLAPVAAAQQQLLDELGRFRPGAVLAPLTEKIEAVVAGLATALPTSQLTAGLDQIIGQVRRITGTLDQAIAVAQTLVTKLALLGDPDAQLNQWLDEILAKLPNDAPTTLATPLAAIAQAVQDAQTAPLQTAYTSARQDLADKLSAAQAHALLARLLQGKSRLTPALVNALPASAAKNDLQTWLTGFDPAGPDFSRSLRTLASLADALSAADTGLTTLLADWSPRYQRSDGILAALVPPTTLTVEALRAWLREAIDRQLGAPVVGFLKQLKILGALLHTFAQGASSLLQAVENKINAVLAAPQALVNAAQQLQELQDRLTHLDLDLFTREVDGLYKQLLDQVRALDPRAMTQALRRHLEELLDDLSLDAIITPALRQQLQQDYQALRTKLSSLDPELLVIAPLEAAYTQNVLPLVDALDVSAAVQIIIDRLNQFPDELQSELTRVDAAYQDMLRAAPTSSPASASASI